MSENNNSDIMLTTHDNPFNPFDDFVAWWKEDLRLGHDCCGFLDKKAKTSEAFSDEVNEIEIERAIYEIVKDFPRIYRVVTRADYDQNGLIKEVSTA